MCCLLLGRVSGSELGASVFQPGCELVSRTLARFWDSAVTCVATYLHPRCARPDGVKALLERHVELRRVLFLQRIFVFNIRPRSHQEPDKP